MKAWIVFLVLSVFLKNFEASPIELRSEDLTDENETQSDVKLNYRLPEDIIPEHYDITLTPFFANESSNLEFTFNGIVKISLKTEKPDVKSIVLHKDRIDVSSFKLMKNEVEVKIVNATYDEPTHKWILNLQEPLTVGDKYVLIAEYVGQMLSDMKGFYRTYSWVNGEKKWMGSTQFQQTSARRAFPCKWANLLHRIYKGSNLIYRF